MAVEKREQEETPLGVPLYMVSFGDMMTIMLTFFILLCSYSTERKAGFVSDGVGSFNDVINTLGLPGILPSDRYPVDLGANRVRYTPAVALNSEMLDDGKGRITDGNRDAMRQMIKEQLKKDDVTRIPVEFIYSPTEIKLTEAHKEAVDIIAPYLYGKEVKIRVDGYAYKEGAADHRDIAARRAQEMANYLVNEHQIERRRIRSIGYGTSGTGPENAKNRLVQDRLGRRIVLLYLVPTE